MDGLPLPLLLLLAFTVPAAAMSALFGSFALPGWGYVACFLIFPAWLLVLIHCLADGEHAYGPNRGLVAVTGAFLGFILFLIAAGACGWFLGVAAASLALTVVLSRCALRWPPTVDQALRTRVARSLLRALASLSAAVSCGLLLIVLVEMVSVIGHGFHLDWVQQFELAWRTSLQAIARVPRLGAWWSFAVLGVVWLLGLALVSLGLVRKYTKLRSYIRFSSVAACVATSLVIGSDRFLNATEVEWLARRAPPEVRLASEIADLECQHRFIEAAKQLVDDDQEAKALAVSGIQQFLASGRVPAWDRDARWAPPGSWYGTYKNAQSRADQTEIEPKMVITELLQMKEETRSRVNDTKHAARSALGGLAASTAPEASAQIIDWVVEWIAREVGKSVVSDRALNRSGRWLADSARSLVLATTLRARPDMGSESAWDRVMKPPPAEVRWSTELLVNRPLEGFTPRIQLPRGR